MGVGACGFAETRHPTKASQSANQPASQLNSINENTTTANDNKRKITMPCVNLESYTEPLIVMEIGDTHAEYNKLDPIGFASTYITV